MHTYIRRLTIALSISHVAIAILYQCDSEEIKAEVCSESCYFDRADVKTTFYILYEKETKDVSLKFRTIEDCNHHAQTLNDAEESSLVKVLKAQLTLGLNALAIRITKNVCELYEIAREKSLQPCTFREIRSYPQCMNFYHTQRQNEEIANAAKAAAEVEAAEKKAKAEKEAKAAAAAEAKAKVEASIRKRRHAERDYTGPRLFFPSPGSKP